VEATAGTSRMGLPLVGVGTAWGPVVVERGVVPFRPSDLGPEMRGGAARSTAVPAFILAIDAY
jgi:hypothetical protein